MTRAAKWIERCLWAIGLLALGTCCYVWMDARHRQAEGSRELDRRMHSVSATKPKLAPGELVGRLEIPRLQLSSIVFEGTDEPVLQRGVGHLPGSPLPGERGNVVLAGHRDSFFRALQNVRERDVIAVTTPAGTRRYTVESTAIVDPDETALLRPTPDSTVTLVTCYPFQYLGHAPQRFVVRGREISDAPAQIAATPAPVKKHAVRNHRPAPPPPRIEATDDEPVEIAQAKPARKRFNPFRFLKKLKP
jgi:sortase A